MYRPPAEKVETRKHGNAAQRRSRCGERIVRLSNPAGEIWEYLAMKKRKHGQDDQGLMEVASSRQFSREGGAGERVQGARAAYGTCFVCPDHPGPPVIPGWTAHQPFRLFVTSKKGTGNKMLLKVVSAHEWI